MPDTHRAELGPRPRGVRDDEEDGLPSYRQPNPQLRANTDALSVAEMDGARLVRASNTFYRSGVTAAQTQLDTTLSDRGWTIDTEMSTAEGLVVTKDNQIRVAYRGTDFRNASDLVTDAAAVGGVERLAPQLRATVAQIEAVQRKYGRVPDRLFGYSKGGAHALFAGDLYGIESTTYNPLIGRAQLVRLSTTNHTIIRTTEDVVSTGLVFAKGKRNFRVKAIDTIVGSDPLSQHKIGNFTQAGARQPGGVERLMQEGIRKGQTLAHYETMDAMARGVEEGKSFTQTLDDFNRTNGAFQRVDVLEAEDGTLKLGPRIHRESGTVKYFLDAGGELSDTERAHLESNPPPPPREYSEEARAMGIGEELTTAQRQFVSSMSPEKRAAFMRQQRQDLETHTRSIDAAVEPHQRVLRSMMPRPTSLATGALGAVVAHATLSAVDPDGKMDRIASEATEGAIAGAASAGLASAVGASAALGPEVLAGASAYIAGTESAIAITRGLERAGVSESTAEAVGSVSGGAVGGVTAAGVSAGATVLGAVAFGAEVGEVAGLVGGPVGVALGMAAGATLGAAIGGVGYLFIAHHHHRSDGHLLAYLEQRRIAAAEEQQRYERAAREGREAFERERAAQEEYDRKRASGARQRELARAAEEGKTVGAEQAKDEVRRAVAAGKVQG